MEDDFEPLTLQGERISSSSAAARPVPEEPSAPTSTSATKKTRRPRKKREGPKKALSCYNIFFQYERARILSRQDHTPHVINEHVVKAVADDYKKRPVRKHRKSHGQITFHNLATTIADRWKALSETDKGFFKRQGTRERLEYERLVAEWLRKQEEQQQQKSREEEQQEEVPSNSDAADKAPKKTQKSKKTKEAKSDAKPSPATSASSSSEQGETGTSRKRSAAAAAQASNSPQTKKLAKKDPPRQTSPAATRIQQVAAPAATTLSSFSNSTDRARISTTSHIKSGGFAPSSLPQMPMNQPELRKAIVNQEARSRVVAGGAMLSTPPALGGPFSSMNPLQQNGNNTHPNSHIHALLSQHANTAVAAPSSLTSMPTPALMAMPPPPALLNQQKARQLVPAVSLKESLVEDIPWSTEVRLSPIFHMHTLEDLVQSLHPKDIQSFF